MSGESKTGCHPYESHAGTATWAVIDRAIRELVENRDLKEATSHDRIVGYLCESLSEGAFVEPKSKKSRDELKTIITAARDEYKLRNPGRDPVAELAAERRGAALRGD